MTHYKTKVVVEFDQEPIYENDITESEHSFGYLAPAKEVAHTFIKAHGKKKGRYSVKLIDIFSDMDGDCVSFVPEEKILVL